jgi:hypothetical protein
MRRSSRPLWILPLLAGWLAAAPAAAVDAPEQVDAVVEVSGVRAGPDGIEAILTNRGASELRDVRLLIDYVYHWPDETRPGDESPGKAWPHVVPGPIPPGASERIRFAPPGGLPSAAGGRFEPRIEVLGFVES